MELFELLDKYGKDIKLTVTDDPFVHPHPIIRVEPVQKTHELEFNVPGWYVCGINIFYAIKLISPHLHHNRGCFNTEFSRPATPQEIETHLRKVCDDKYVGRRVRCLSFPNDIEVIKKFERYDGISEECDADQMVYNSESNRLMVVYSRGKFAEIVPDEPKGLPETVEELKELIYKFKYTCGDNYSIGEFLRKQGYKTA